MFRSRPNLPDAIAVAVVLLCAAALFLSSFFSSGEGELLSVTTPDGETLYPLSEDRTLTVTGRDAITLTVVIEGGSVRVSESGCRDHVCVAGGKISGSGETLVCAPAGVSLRILGKGGAEDVDFLAG